MTTSKLKPKPKAKAVAPAQMSLQPQKLIRMGNHYVDPTIIVAIKCCGANLYKLVTSVQMEYELWLSYHEAQEALISLGIYEEL